MRMNLWWARVQGAQMEVGEEGEAGVRGGAGQELIAHRAGGAPAHRACSQLSSQHMSQSAEMSPK